MGIALVADIEDEFVLREVEIPVKGNGQFDDAEVRSEMAAIKGGLRDDFLADIVAKQSQR
jgi:hypothetical protein